MVFVFYITLEFQQEVNTNAATLLLYCIPSDPFCTRYPAQISPELCTAINHNQFTSDEQPLFTWKDEDITITLTTAL